MRTLIAASVVVFALAGCAPIGGTTDLPPSSEPTETATATPAPEPDALVLGVQGITLIDGEGAADTIVSREDVAGSVALLTGLFGDPATESTPYGVTYDWGVVSGSDTGWFNVRFEATDLDGVELRTSQGIQVGAGRDEVLALSPYDEEYDGDGDGKSDRLGLEPVPEPGTDSLAHPGEVGTSYVDILFDGDTVVALVAPAGDWRDV
jgi:hypothetical protein